MARTQVANTRVISNRPRTRHFSTIRHNSHNISILRRRTFNSFRFRRNKLRTNLLRSRFSTISGITLTGVSNQSIRQSTSFQRPNNLPRTHLAANLHRRPLNRQRSRATILNGNSGIQQMGPTLPQFLPTSRHFNASRLTDTRIRFQLMVRSRFITLRHRTGTQLSTLLFAHRLVRFVSGRTRVIQTIFLSTTRHNLNFLSRHSNIRTIVQMGTSTRANNRTRIITDSILQHTSYTRRFFNSTFNLLQVTSIDRSRRRLVKTVTGR